MALMDVTEKDNNNVATRSELIRKTATIEASVIAWMAEATQLHSDVDAGDKANVLALLTDLRAKLASATAI